MRKYSYRRKKFDFGNFEITKREILTSISIIAVMILIGVLISNKISEHQIDKNEIYNKAVKIESKELFQYGMETNVGNAFVYGDLEAVDTVTYPEISGEYMYVKKIKEKYTPHTRTVTYTTGSGKSRRTHTRVETYWTWDKVGSEDKKCNEVIFCEIKFNSNKIQLPNAGYINTVKESKHIRYKFYGVGIKYTGTIFTNLRDKTISDKSKFYNSLNIEESVEYLESDSGIVIFWIFWVLLICGCVFVFYYLDNKWLE